MRPQALAFCPSNAEFPPRHGWQVCQPNEWKEDPGGFGLARDACISALVTKENERLQELAKAKITKGCHTLCTVRCTDFVVYLSPYNTSRNVIFTLSTLLYPFLHITHDIQIPTCFTW